MKGADGRRSNDLDRTRPLAAARIVTVRRSSDGGAAAPTSGTSERCQTTADGCPVLTQCPNGLFDLRVSPQALAPAMYDSSLPWTPGSNRRLQSKQELAAPSSGEIERVRV